MSTSTKRGSSFGTLVVVAALAVAAVVYTSGKPKQREDRFIKVSVIFSPSATARLTPVIVNVTANGSSVYKNERVKVSPWEQVIPVRKGSTVTVTASQQVPSKLACAINDVVQETTEFPGTVHCQSKA